jgi:hypothetical protein
MKYLIYGFAIAALWACGNNSKETAYGEKLDSTQAVHVDEALSAFESSGKKEAVIKGQISQVCTGEGCWYTLKHGDKEQFVGFDKFTIPKDVTGKFSIATGYFYRDTQTVEQLREGLSEAEAEKITEPKISVQFQAKGIVVK